jgi:hypothetical protein
MAGFSSVYRRRTSSTTSIVRAKHPARSFYFHPTLTYFHHFR